MAVAMAVSYGLIVSFGFTRTFFEIDMFTGNAWFLAALCIAVAGAAIALLPRFVRRKR